MNASTAAAVAGLALLVLVLLVRWKLRRSKPSAQVCLPSCEPVQLVHRLCPHNNVVQRYEVDKKDSLDEHLDVLTRKLAEKVSGTASGMSRLNRRAKLHTSTFIDKRFSPETENNNELEVALISNSILNMFARKMDSPMLEHMIQVLEGRLHMSKYKIRETQDEIQNLHAIDNDVRTKYREIMESLRSDLMSNEKECKKLQEQIEWVSRRRAELRDEMRRGQKLYGDAAMELASNLAELQRGRCKVDHKITDKPQQRSTCSLRLRKEPNLPRASPVESLTMKTSPRLSTESIRKYRHIMDP